MLGSPTQPAVEASTSLHFFVILEGRHRCSALKNGACSLRAFLYFFPSILTLVVLYVEFFQEENRPF